MEQAVPRARTARFTGGFALTFLKKIGVYLLVLLGLSILIFLIARVIPGDPARQALGPNAPEETVQALREEMNLNKPIWMQYVLWLGNVLHGDFGQSLLTRRSVVEDIRQYLPATLEIVLLSAVFMSLGGIYLGVLAAKYNGKWLDGLIRVLSYLGIVAPAFVWAVLFMLLFGYLIPILPTTGRISITMNAPAVTITRMFTVDYLLSGNFAGFWDAFKHLILPAFSLMLGGMAQAARLTRGNMVDNSQKDYIIAQQAYGVPEREILHKYLLKASLIPTLTILPLDIAALFGTAFLIENLFNYPGISRYGLNAMLNTDLNAISGVVLVFGLIFLLTNVLADLIVAWLDPRVRLMGRET